MYRCHVAPLFVCLLKVNVSPAPHMWGMHACMHACKSHAGAIGANMSVALQAGTAAVSKSLAVANKAVKIAKDKVAMAEAAFAQAKATVCGLGIGW